MENLASGRLGRRATTGHAGRALVVLTLLAGLVAVLLALPQTSVAAVAEPTLRVSGQHLTDAGGTPLELTGAARAGTEYACAQGWGLVDGSDTPASLDVMRSWRINTVRVPLNEHCWLARNGVKPEYSGVAYRSAVRELVDRFRSHGFVVVLDLHLTGPGSQLALQQAPMPDVEHSIPFWRSVATEYRDIPGIAFELFNEPRDVDWSCWRDGCEMPGGWQAAGMQQLLDAVRSTGARQPVIVEGLGWGNDLSGWNIAPLDDPAEQLVAGWHVYEHSQCRTADCWDRTVAPVARHVPVVVTEMGQTDCEHAWFDGLLTWLEAQRVHYIAWTWNVWPGCGGPTLILDWSGTPTAWGQRYRDHLQSRQPWHGHTDYADAVTEDQPIARYSFERVLQSPPNDQPVDATLPRTPGAMQGSAALLIERAGQVVRGTPSVPAGPNWTIESWVRVDQDAAAFSPFWQTSEAAWWGLLRTHQMSSRRGSPSISAYGSPQTSGGAAKEMVAPFTVGQWHHVALTSGPSDSRLYVNGVLVGRRNSTPEALRGWAFGASGQSGFKGALDEVAVYDVQLSAQRVRAHYQAAQR